MSKREGKIKEMGAVEGKKSKPAINAEGIKPIGESMRLCITVSERERETKARLWSYGNWALICSRIKVQTCLALLSKKSVF